MSLNCVIIRSAGCYTETMLRAAVFETVQWTTGFQNAFYFLMI